MNDFEIFFTDSDHRLPTRSIMIEAVDKLSAVEKAIEILGMNCIIVEVYRMY